MTGNHPRVSLENFFVFLGVQSLDKVYVTTPVKFQALLSNITDRFTIGTLLENLIFTRNSLTVSTCMGLGVSFLSRGCCPVKLVSRTRFVTSTILLSTMTTPLLPLM